MITKPKAGGVSAHDHDHEDHHLGARRRFLRQLGLISAGTALLPGTSLQALGSSRLVQAIADNPSDRILVLIRLKGGNDGLNTIVPVYDYARYVNARPRIAYQQQDLLALTNELSVSTDFSAAHQMWQQGAMRVVNGVGYPDPNLSHFRGTDIITSASDAQEVLRSGWLGRHLDACFPDYLSNPPAAPPAIQIGGSGSLTFLNDENVSLAVNVRSVEELTTLAQSGQLYATDDLPDCFYGEQLGYLRGVANSTFVFAGGIRDAYDLGSNAVAYPGGQLSAQLSVLARLIKGGLDTKLYLVTLDGFDTHAGQENAHPQLLRQLGQSVQAFFDDLAQSGDEQRVLASTFSEFGRRIEQNASSGTDHGTAAPQLLFSPSLNGNGTTGALPSLSQPDPNGNLNFTTDYRSVYATLLEHWLCIPATQVDQVLGGNFDRLALGFDCQSVSTSSPRVQTADFTVAVQRSLEGWVFRVDGPQEAYRLRLLDVLGRVQFEQSFGPLNNELRLALSDLPTGGSIRVYSVEGQAGALVSGMLPLLR